MRLIFLTLLTMMAFAANSVFGRLALEPNGIGGWIDPASYSLVRLGAGAVMLSVLVLFQHSSWSAREKAPGNWLSAFSLFTYAVAFSFAYVSLETGMGALILFSCVQGTMIGWAVYHGDRPNLLELTGMITAFGAFLWLVSPGLAAPDPAAAMLMALAGIAWGIYSLRGKNSEDPLLATTGNFVRALPFAALVTVLGFRNLHVTPFGISMAIASGAISSAIGYAIWYHVLENLRATQAAIIQLSVPVIAGIGGFLLLNEPITQRFFFASVLILGGIAIAIMAKSKRV